MSHCAAPAVKLEVKADGRLVSRSPVLVPVLVCLLSAGTLALGAGAIVCHAAVSQMLYAGFDADGNIKMSFADGTMIGTPSPPGTVVPAGTYQVILNNNTDDDLAVLHKFHLFGPGVDLVGTSVQLTATVTFQPGATYVYQDDLHPDTLHEVFGTPGSGATSTTPGGSTSTGSSSGSSSGSGSASGGSAAAGSTSAIGTQLDTSPIRGTLTGSVGASGKLALSKGGKAVTTIRAGRYRIVVVDASSKGGFSVQEIRRQAVVLTGVAFVGRRAVTVDLRAGQWMFFSPAAAKNYFVVIG